MATVPTFPPGTALQQADLLFLVDPPAGAVYQATGQAVASGTTTVITWDTLWQQNDPTMWSSGSRLQMNTSGRWLFTANLRWPSNATGYRFLDVRKNAGGSGAGGSSLTSDFRPAVSGNVTSQSISIIVPGIVAGDYVELFGFQNSGGPLTLNAGAIWGAASLSAQRVGS